MDSTAKKCDCLTRQHRGEEPSKMTRTLRNVAMRWVVFTGALLTVPCSFASSIGKPPLETIPVPDVAPLPEVSRADDSQNRLIAEVVVTAQKREENLQDRSEENTSELQSLMRISYAVFCLKKKNQNK